MSALQHISAVYRRVINIITNGIQTASTIQTGGTATAQIMSNPFLTAQYPMMQHYGFNSVPLPGALHTKVAMAGDKSNAVSIASNDSRYRPTTMTDGEVMLYNNNGVRVYLKSGSLEVYINSILVASFAAGGLSVTGAVNTTGNVVVGTGATGSFSDSTGRIITVQDGIITNIF